ncbi:MAG: alpha/beta fold hydrolase [Bacteroidota bacterium]
MLRKLHIFLLLPFIIAYSCSSFKDKKSINIQTGYLEHAGAQLFYKSIGTGEALIFLHGGPGMSHDYFLPHMEMLAEQFQLIFFDQRAAGKSSFALDSTNMSMDQMVDDIEAIRKYFNLEKINLLGHSWGGLLAMWYANRFPDKLKRFILVNTIPPNKDYEVTSNKNLQSKRKAEDIAEMQKIMQSDAFKQRDSLSLLRLFKLNFAPSFYHRAYLDSLELTIADNFVERQSKLNLLMPDLTSYNFYPALKQIKVSSLLIHGAYDATPIEAINLIADQLDNVEMHTLKEAGHFTFIEAKQEFKDIIFSFMKR